MTEKKIYFFKQKELENFLSWFTIESMNHPNMTMKGLIKLIYNKHNKKENKQNDT